MKLLLLIGIIFGILALIWVFLIEPEFLAVKKYKLEIPGLKGLRLVFASDFHAKPGSGKRLFQIVERINAQNPDIILLGGDFVNGHKSESAMRPEKAASILSGLKSKYGVYAILGNHDWYQGGEKIAAELEKADIRVMENENCRIGAGGREFTLAVAADIVNRKPDLKQALKEAKKPLLLLSHSPDLFPEVPKEVDLTIAGHTHGGQVRIPGWGALLVPSKYGKRYDYGLIEEGGKKLLVSKGIGTSMLPVRFNCLPEIVVIDFE